MRKYQKIKTIYKRNPEDGYKTVIEGEFATPEFGLLRDAQWEFTEKVDGCNVRVMRTANEIFVGSGNWEHGLEFRGRTDKAQTPQFLLDCLGEKFSLEGFADTFDDDSSVCLYGEGYGAQTVKGGGKYIADGVDFILFDVWVGDWSGRGLWLQRKDVEDIAKKLMIDVVPFVWSGTLLGAVEIARKGFLSRVADNKETPAEGLVLRPAVELRDRRGQRIIAKIKHSDFALEGE